MHYAYDKIMRRLYY